MAKIDNVLKRLASYTDTVIEWQKNLVAIPALGPDNGGHGELEKSRYVMQLLQEIGCDELVTVDAPDERVPAKVRPNILATIYGADRSRTAWVFAHLDVVPAGDLKNWNSDPFTLVVEGDKMIGRGVEDNHQGLLCGLLAAKALREEGIIPNINIGLAIVSDEESGSKYGLEYVLHHNGRVFRPDDLIIVPDAGDPLGVTIEVSEKSIMWIRFAVRGKQCHASTPQHGLNAHRVGAHLIVALDKLYELFPQRDEVYDTPYSTFEPTKKEANVPNINTIPGDDVFYYDCRVLPNYSLDEVVRVVKEIAATVAEKFGAEIDVTFPQKEQAAAPTAANAPVVLALGDAIKKVKKIEPVITGIGGGTVASLFRRAGLAAVVWGTIADTCHQPNEYALVSNTLSDAAVLAALFLAD